MPDTAPPFRLHPRLRLKDGATLVLGPGRIDLLERIRDSGSISAAARAMGMSYRRAWLLVEAVNLSFRTPLVESVTGGQRGGGARLTATGEAVVALYRQMEEEACRAMAPAQTQLEALLSPSSPQI
ncbi:winged helix-turn-helix domain-containing protein [Novispirillum itersonii]|uniref:winged helix-turn-helix domain-containing protein n=1 Tax=Novispirillum itersonii TaxID=189 RepID=UPI000371180C|nr:winged helix-turn-helix domain-containing protein [Novispirillum itersonii]